MDNEATVLPVKDEIACIRINRVLLDKIKGRMIGPCYITLNEREDGTVDMVITEAEAKKEEEESSSMQKALEKE